MKTTSKITYKKGLALWFIFLMVSIPFYSSSAFAAPTIQITKNSGEKGLDGFIDAKGDIWQIEATVVGAGDIAVDPSNVTLVVGDHSSQFNSCSQTDLGATCQYISPLPQGIREGIYPFDITLNYLDELQVPRQTSNAATISADGSAPTVTFTSAVQNSQDGKIHLDFEVNDKTVQAPSVGLESIDIIDAGSNTILQHIDVEDGETEYRYSDDPRFDQTVQASFEGEGFRRLKITATDLLGHRTHHPPIKEVKVDFALPIIKAETLNVTNLGRFMGQLIIPTDLHLDVSDLNFKSITLASDQLDIAQSEGDCQPDDEDRTLLHCTWRNLFIHPAQQIALTFIAKDDFENTQTQTITKSDFILDTEAPVIEFFGTLRTFEGKNFVSTQSTNKLILRVRDVGSGINPNLIAANLKSLSKGENEPPTECIQTSQVLECSWDIRKQTSLSTDVVTVGLTQLKDNVGNVALKPSLELSIDSVSPIIEDLSFHGLSDIGEQDYFQSNDQLKIDFTTIEGNGLDIFVDVREIILDARTKFTYGQTDEFGIYHPDKHDGFEHFSQDACTRDEGRWHCSLVTQALRSGFISNAHLTLEINDNAGNLATQYPSIAGNVKSGAKGQYQIDILGLSSEENPDYWEVAPNAVKAQLPFVDLDTTNLIYTRMPMGVTFQTDIPQAKILDVELAGCSPVDGSSNQTTATPEISRSIIYGSSTPVGQESPAKVNILLEFSPFDGKELFGLTDPSGKFELQEVEYTCQFRLFSKVNKDAIHAPELQDVVIKVPFAFSTIGSLDENVAQKVKELKEGDFLRFANALSYVDTALKWIKFIGNILAILQSAQDIIALFQEGTKASADIYEKTVIGTPIGGALRGGCLELDAATKASWGFMKYIQIPVRIASCEPDPSNLDYYGKWQEFVLQNYNLVTLRGPAGIPATNLYENIYVSIAGICVPGIIYNLNKAREIQCRRIICYGREVPQGIATFDACDKLYDLQMC